MATKKKDKGKSKSYENKIFFCCAGNVDSLFLGGYDLRTSYFWSEILKGIRNVRFPFMFDFPPITM